MICFSCLFSGWYALCNTSNYLIRTSLHQLTSNMKAQNYKNHIRFYPIHHFVFYPLVLILLIASVAGIFRYPDHKFEFGALAVVLVLITWLSLMLRQHYALLNQNRIVRLEMRLRYYQLTQQRFEAVEQRLSFVQVAALRFAPDEELPALVRRTLEENLSADDIMKSIQNWLPDDMRV